MIDTIFIESSDTLGLLYDRYKKIPGEIDGFLNQVQDAIDMAYNEKIPEEDEINLVQELKNFLQKTELDMKNPEAIDPENIKSMRSKVQAIKDSTNKILIHLANLRKKAKFGQNWINGILIKPKVYSRDIDEDFQYKVNRFVRNIGRCLDWAEKITLDLMNLADQDLNILSLVQKVYFRNIYESDMDLLLKSSNIENELITEFDSGFSKSDEDDEDDDKIDILQQHYSTEEFVPIFSIIMSMDFDKLDDPDLDPKKRKMIQSAITINKITLGENYTHTLVSFDTSLEHMYEYMGNGFGETSILTNPQFECTKSIYVNCTFVTTGEADMIKDQVKQFLEDKEHAQYDITHLLGQVLGTPSAHIDKRMICSTFVGYLLSQADQRNLHRDYTMLRPEDMTILPRAFYVINFRDKDDFIKRRDEFMARVKKIYDDNIDEIREYNNILPKVVFKSKLKEAGSIHKFFDWLVKKFDVVA